MSKEIVMACIKYCDRIYTGFNHTECFNKLNREERIIVHSRLEEGFIDSDGNFVDRKQAMIIAKEANQVKFEKSTLMSEDLYLDWLKKQDKENQKLKQQLAEYSDLNNVLNKGLSEKCISCEEEHNQDKISFAVEKIQELKKFTEKEIKECNKLLQEEFEDDYYIQSVNARQSMCYEFKREIDIQINLLKEGK